MSCGVCRKHSLDPAWLWLWCRLEAAALIQPLDWELPYATGVALKRQKTKKKSEDIMIPPTPASYLLTTDKVCLA